VKTLFDTSVLVAAMIESHPAHPKAFAWLQQVKNSTIIGYVPAHSIAELYAILTVYPIKPRIHPLIARKMIWHNVFEIFNVVSLSAQDYAEITEHLSESEIIGGVTYDAVILYTALKTDIDRILTLNPKDFRRIYSELSDKIIAV
jgi:predicted nucleic acid-binding protein